MHKGNEKQDRKVYVHNELQLNKNVNAIDAFN